MSAIKKLIQRVKYPHSAKPGVGVHGRGAAVITPGPPAVVGDFSNGNMGSTGNMSGSLFDEPIDIAHVEMPGSAMQGGAASLGFLDEEKNVFFRWALILGAGYLFFTKTRKGREIADKVGFKSNPGRPPKKLKKRSEGLGMATKAMKMLDPDAKLSTCGSCGATISWMGGHWSDCPKAGLNK